MARGQGVKRPPQVRDRFIELLAEGLNPREAAAECGVSARTPYCWRAEDPEYEKRWKTAYTIGTDVFVREAERRAVEGVTKGIYHKGKKVGTTREYSDVLLIFLLKSRDPFRFCERTRAAAIEREIAKHEAATQDNSAEAKAAAVAALERIAAGKALAASRPPVLEH